MFEKVAKRFHVDIVLMGIYFLLIAYYYYPILVDGTFPSMRWLVTPILQCIVIILYIIFALSKDKSNFLHKMFYWTSAAYFFIQVIEVTCFNQLWKEIWLQTALWIICGALFIALAQNLDVMLLQRIALIALLCVSIYQNIYLSFVWSDIGEWSVSTILYVFVVEGLYPLPLLLDTFFGKSMKG